jgi:O-antigen ligase
LSIGIWLWFTLRHWKPVRAHLAMEGGIAVAAVFFALNLIALQNGPNAPGSFEPSSRVLVWSSALRTFSDDPLTGKGLGQVVSSVVYQNTDGSFSLLTDAHNVFLSIAAQAGVIGLIALLVLMGYVLRLGMGVNFAENRDAYLASGLGLAFLSAFVYQGLTGSSEDARHLWVLIGLIPAAGSFQKSDFQC